MAEEVRAWCVRCRDKKLSVMRDGKEVTMKNGMKALKGVCVKCGTKMMRILGKAK